NGFTFSITPNKYGSSLAAFKLKYVGDFTGEVALDGPLALRFKNAVADGGSTVNLAGGKFTFGKVRGALVAPSLFLARARATLKGPGKDLLTLIVGFASGATPPAQASDLTIG